MSLCALLLFLPLLAAQSIVCVPGQCLQGYSNTTIGAKLSTFHLLPGVYTATTDPQPLHDALISSSSLIASPGFSNSTSLPLNLALQSGLSVYTGPLYSGQATFQSLPSQPLVNISIPLSSQSLAISNNVWTALTSNNNRFIVWDAIPDVTQLPSNIQGSLALTDIQSAACTPACASSGVCTSAGTCQCSPGFAGASCESCASGFFGPQCQACPAGCKDCDEGITGSGRCLKPAVANDPSTCNCTNGICGSNGQCLCNTGFTTGDNGTLCSKCSPGFFLAPNGDCQVCQIGCTECADNTGVCTSCKPGFSQDANDRTKCTPPVQATSSGQTCPSGSFANGASCSPCSPACETCTGATANDCVVCKAGSFTFNGQCVSANSDGVCQGSDLIADNNKRECDSCGAKCTKCSIPNFSVASTVDQKQCTACLPGFFLSNGACVESCPAGTTVSSQDNLTCIPCDASCTSCSGTSSFCLTCANNQLASAGQCISSCPSNTFSSSGACLPCHPDCASCSGGSFNQCTSCPPSRPVPSNGRCLPTCARNQFFDGTACQTCDASCASCSGPGSSSCLACSSATQVLQSGSCVSANCQSNSNVIPGLGVCLSSLVLSTPSGTGTAPPLPSITGLDSPTVVVERGRRLEWWQILLMALGCAFIFIVVVWLFRRKQRKRVLNSGGMPLPTTTKKKKTSSWGSDLRWKLIRWGEKLFGHTRSRRATTVRGAPIVHLGPDVKMYTAEEDARAVVYPVYASPPSRSKLLPTLPPKPTPTPTPTRPPRGSNDHLPIADDDDEDEDMVRLIGSYNRPPTPPQGGAYHHDNRHSTSDASTLSAPSLYSQMTGMPRRVPDPRLPVKNSKVELPRPRPHLGSRFSMSTFPDDERRVKRVKEEPERNPFWK